MVVGTWNTTTLRENAPVTTSEPQKFGCECGRSPTGKCVGWHRLSDTGYVDMFAKWQKASQGFKTFKERDEFFENNKVPKKDKSELTKEEAFDAIVKGLDIMADGIGGDFDPPTGAIDPDLIEANPLLEEIVEVRPGSKENTVSKIDKIKRQACHDKEK